MDFIRDNWFWIVVFVFFILMHAGHGGHGGHGGSGRAPRRGEPDPRDAGGHHHH
ncbi:MAG: hypothetical protein R2752_11970 [Vicinamibacterales bacterium]